MIRRIVVALPAVVLVAALAACAPPSDPTGDGELRIVASTNVYGDLATTIADPTPR